jgi:formylglycine-generating enzyme required for sulfatase activity
VSRFVPRSRCGSSIVAALVAAMMLAAPGSAEAGAPAPAAAGPEMARIAAGRYRPLYRQPVRGADRDTLIRVVVPVDVPAFELARLPVTNAEYLAFVTAHPQWRRSQVSKLFADASYLRHWRGDLDPGPRAPARSPVVHVSWFAARAYAAAQGCRLPAVSEWEYVAAADERVRDASRDPAFLDRIRTFASRPTPDVLPPVGGRFRNAWGIEDMHGLVWEWTLDFNSALVSGESRGDASLERPLYCGSGASNAGDFADYAAFMRFAYRASLEATYTTANLGFRCARDVAPREEAPR